MKNSRVIQTQTWLIQDSSSLSLTHSQLVLLCEFYPQAGFLLIQVSRQQQGLYASRFWTVDTLHYSDSSNWALLDSECV